MIRARRGRPEVRRGAAAVTAAIVAIVLPYILGVASVLPLGAAEWVLYLSLISLLALGVAAAVRDTAVAMGTVLCLLYLFPIIAAVAASPHWQWRLQQIGPTTAGLEIEATRNLGSLPISPWAGLGVLAAWAVAAVVAGGLQLRFRDA